MKSNKVDQTQSDTCLQGSVSIKTESSLESSLKELTIEAASLFKVLDATSAKIHQLEVSLSDLKANFPFQLPIKEEKPSLRKKISKSNINDRNLNHSFAHSIDGYYTKVFWYLSWEPIDENSKNYRLFLKAEEKEITFGLVADIQHIYEDTDQPLGYDETETKSTVILKKPLVETDLKTRLQYSEYLIPFINGFKDHLRQYRMSIEKGNQLPNKDKKQSFDDDLPF